MENKIITLMLILLSMFVGWIAVMNISFILNPLFFEKIILLMAISVVGLGFTAYGIDRKSEFIKIREDLFNANIILIFSLLTSILYLANQTATWGFISMILFITGLVYFLLILIVSRLWIHNLT